MGLGIVSAPRRCRCPPISPAPRSLNSDQAEAPGRTEGPGGAPLVGAWVGSRSRTRRQPLPASGGPLSLSANGCHPGLDTIINSDVSNCLTNIQ